MKKKSMEPVTGKVFERIASGDFDTSAGVYEGCRFVQCNFAQAGFSGLVFRECAFEQCDLSMARLAGASLQEVRFSGCKLLGVQFGECRKLLLEMSFERCMMRLSVFAGLDLKNTRFSGCDLQEADFTDTNLVGALFDDCDLRLAIIFHANLEKADFRTAFNFSIPPESNRLRKAKFSLHGLPGLLDGYGIEIE